MKKYWISLALVMLCLMLTATNALADLGSNYAPSTSLTMRLSTRTGPSTAYTEPGTFFQNSWQNTSVKVISKAYGNDVWWVQVEFMNDGQLMRAYTGAKRVALDIRNVPEETVYATAYVDAAGDIEGYYGPGNHYARHKDLVSCYASGTIIDAQDEYLLFDFYDEYCRQQRRAWIYAGLLHVDWFNGQPSGAILDNRAAIVPGDLFFEEYGEPAWCRLLSYSHNETYTMIDLYLHGLAYTNLPVYMEGADYGTFYTSDGTSGYIWFYTDMVVIDYYAQTLSSGATYRLMKSR